MGKNTESRKRTDWFVHDRFGMFIHWGLYAMPARNEWIRNIERMTVEQYQKYFDRFDPDLYNPDGWAEAAASAGMKYFVITAKHHDGFCLWDSKHTGYKATNTPAGRDLLRPMIDAFRKRGLKIGIYYSLLDWHHPEFPVDKHHPQRDDKEFRDREKKRDVRKYAEYMRRQVTELLTKFGRIDILWFDFSYPGDDGKGCKDWESEKLLKLVRRLQPGIIIDNRLDLKGAGDFETPEQFQPQEGLKDKDGNPVIWEACQTFSGSWGYHRDEMTWRSSREIIGTLIDCVSKNGNLLMNVGPTARGEFDSRAASRLKDIGAWMQKHSRSIYGCGKAPSEFSCPPGCSLTFNRKTNRLYVHLLSYPYKHVVLRGKAYLEKVDYAQFLHDGSEIRGPDAWIIKHKCLGEDVLVMNIPQAQPDPQVPVIEIFLK